MARTERKLGDLISVGPAMLRDFELLGIRNMAQLARQNPQRMYERLSRATGDRQDPCVLDTFCAAVGKRGTRGWRRRSASGGIGAEEGSKEAKK